MSKPNATSKGVPERSHANGRRTAFRKAYEEGFRRGFELGFRRGQSLTVLEVVRRKFGEPSPALTARILREAAHETGPWIERILAAETLAELEDAADR